MDKKYFISYQTKCSTDECWQFHQKVIKVHPAKWLSQKLDCHHYIILFYKEITEEEFELFEAIL